VRRRGLPDPPSLTQETHPSNSSRLIKSNLPAPAQFQVASKTTGRVVRCEKRTRAKTFSATGTLLFLSQEQPLISGGQRTTSDAEDRPRVCRCETMQQWRRNRNVIGRVMNLKVGEDGEGRRLNVETTAKKDNSTGKCHRGRRARRTWFVIVDPTLSRIGYGSRRKVSITCQDGIDRPVPSGSKIA